MAKSGSEGARSRPQKRPRDGTMGAGTQREPARGRRQECRGYPHPGRCAPAGDTSVWPATRPSIDGVEQRHLELAEASEARRYLRSGFCAVDTDSFNLQGSGSFRSRPLQATSFIPPRSLPRSASRPHDSDSSWLSRMRLAGGDASTSLAGGDASTSSPTPSLTYSQNPLKPWRASPSSTTSDTDERRQTSRPMSWNRSNAWWPLYPPP